jgi:DNA-binding NarL/FixJ family response regulator
MQIGAKLFISEKTTSLDVNYSLARLSANRRTERHDRPERSLADS